MSYDIDLIDPTTNEPVKVSLHEEGGTYAVGGINDASLNVTYNYSKFFRDTIDKENGIRWLYGKTGKEVIDTLETAVNTLGTDKDSDQWTPTEGNAGYALSILLEWAKQYPNAVFKGD